jgi:phage repressor protein C with HTH and peptisase S24 domain
MTHDRRTGGGRTSERNELERLLAEADPELLAEQVGRVLLDDPDWLARQDERFLRWLADEARARTRPRRRAESDAEFEARGAEFRARVEAKRLRVLRPDAAEPAEPDERMAAHASDVQALAAAKRGGPVPLVDLGIAAGVGRELWHEPVEQFVMLPQEVPDGRYVALRIVGDSMVPLMHSGDTVLVRLGTDVAKDTVIVARHPDDGYVCKRVARVRRDRLELASLAPGRPPVVVPRQAELIVGTVVLVWCTHR